jgi:hypothetical protein
MRISIVKQSSDESSEETQRRRTDRRTLEEVGRALRRHDVQKLKLLLARLAVWSRRKRCHLFGIVNRDEVVVKESGHVPLLADLFERGAVLGDAEHACRVGVKSVRLKVSTALRERDMTHSECR